jgi:hypothetical protein
MLAKALVTLRFAAHKRSYVGEECRGIPPNCLCMGNQHRSGLKLAANRFVGCIHPNPKWQAAHRRGAPRLVVSGILEATEHVALDVAEHGQASSAE